MGWEITEIMFPVRVVFTECYLLVMILVSHIILSLKFQKKKLVEIMILLVKKQTRAFWESRNLICRSSNPITEGGRKNSKIASSNINS